MAERGILRWKVGTMGKLIDIRDQEATKRKQREAVAGANEYDAEARINEHIAVVADWCDAVGAVYEPKGGGFSYRDQTRTTAFMGSICWQALAKKGFSEKHAQTAFRLYADLQREHLVDGMRVALPLQPMGTDAKLIEFVKFMTGTDAPRDLDIHVFRHFLWQVKRRVHGLSTEWEMMPLFTGGQGFGKTRHLERLWGSIPGLINFTAQGQRLTILKDDFGRRIFNRCYIIPFDEMSNAASMDMETLKMMITAHTVDARVMRAEDYQSFRMNATFYGTSNVSGSANLSDATGMRRFWEFTAPNRQYRDEDGVFLENLGLAGVFAGIDAREGSVSPIKPHLVALQALQASTFKARDPLSQFFDEYVVRTEEPKRIRRSVLHKVFRNWCEGQRIGRFPTMSQLQDYVTTRYGREFIKKLSTGVEFEGIALNLENEELREFINENV
jgi:hypothetical protein